MLFLQLLISLGEIVILLLAESDLSFERPDLDGGDFVRVLEGLLQICALLGEHTDFVCQATLCRNYETEILADARDPGLKL